MVADSTPNPVNPVFMKRRRIYVACLNCRRRKIRCIATEETEPCERCTKKKLTCEYMAVSEENAKLGGPHEEHRKSLQRPPSHSTARPGGVDGEENFRRSNRPNPTNFGSGFGWQPSSSQFHPVEEVCGIDSLRAGGYQNPSRLQSYHPNTVIALWHYNSQPHRTTPILQHPTQPQSNFPAYGDYNHYFTNFDMHGNVSALVVPAIAGEHDNRLKHAWKGLPLVFMLLRGFGGMHKSRLEHREFSRTQWLPTFIAASFSNVACQGTHNFFSPGFSRIKLLVQAREKPERNDGLLRRSAFPDAASTITSSNFWTPNLTCPKTKIWQQARLNACDALSRGIGVPRERLSRVAASGYCSTYYDSSKPQVMTNIALSGELMGSKGNFLSDQSSLGTSRVQ
ncbi:hypothetical protein DFH07DRAFT_765763 [Mycena maculata]|uniref:Zn(2)-C6 fungal-type domain-containing protein n=1 Tax=Mycena maculata TaxID=230809 RepID=A0AAD7NXW8_9AGAR|nr:hypothetical protein DFH07DRAFT_765763 [Mycena maculata]